MSRPNPTEAERLRSLNSLLEVGLALPLEQRPQWLAQLPAQHRELSGLLGTLLARAEVETDDFLRTPLSLAPDDTPGSEQPLLVAGTLVGPYRLVRELGTGGMAEVWLAEREDGARRAVALKLPHLGWSAGIDRRVARERDILAALEHPNIARLYEAGITPEGRPWLAMEYVQGLPLDAHCREHRLNLHQRLTLFLQVTDAVVYAHSRLVVHRDLKPSNILVTLTGQVRLLDFGVAKLLQDDEAGGQLTQALGCAVTPDYAAPEQAAGQDVSLATDVYALGIVLYELLAGHRPYSMTGVPVGRLHQALQMATVPLASARAGADAGLARQLRGDLDNILAKALRKNPAERYVSVEALATDLQRHLAGEPVLAQPRARWYRLGKFLKRNRLLVATSSVTMLALTGGLGVAMWQNAAVKAQKAIALESLNQANTSFDFASRVLMDGVGANESVTLNQLLDRAVAIAERSFSEQPTQRVVAVDAAASWLMAVGRLDDAQHLLGRALTSFAPADQNGLVHELRCKRGHALVQLGRQNDGLRELNTGAQAALALPTVAAYCQQRLAYAAGQANDAPARLRHMLAAVQAFKAGGETSVSKKAHLLADLGSAYADNGKMQASDQHFQQALDLIAQGGHSDSVPGRSARNNWAVVRLQVGDPRAALAQLELVIASEQQRSGLPVAALSVRSNMANALNQMGRHEEALSMAQALLPAARQASSPLQQVRALALQATALAGRGLVERALPLLEESASILQRGEVPPTSSGAQMHHAAQGLVWLQLNRPQEAHESYNRLVAGFQKGNARVSGLVYALVGRSAASLALGQREAAQADAAQALALARQLQGDMPASLATGRAWLALAAVHHHAGRAQEGQAAAAEAAKQLEVAVGPQHAQSVQARALAAAPR